MKMSEEEFKNLKTGGGKIPWQARRPQEHQAQSTKSKNENLKVFEISIENFVDFPQDRRPAWELRFSLASPKIS